MNVLRISSGNVVFFLTTKDSLISVVQNQKCTLNFNKKRYAL